jgi:hypothetical protein
MRKDHFTDEALAAAKALARLDYAEEASAEALDFARCQRPDGSFYGTSGQCRTGTPAGTKQEEPKVASNDAKSLKKALDGLYKKEQEARQAGDNEAARKFMRAHVNMAKQLDKLEVAQKKSPQPKKSSAKGGTPEQKMQLDRLQDRLDDAVTIKEQERISSAISELQKRMRG